MDLLDELSWRQLLKDCSDVEALRAHLAARPRVVYCGFDPSAPSLTIGNLVPMMLLRHFQAAGHGVVVVQGGATGRIGDPSGKDAERGLRPDEEVEADLQAQQEIFRRVLGADVTMVDNYQWFRGMGFLDALRNVGKHFSINQMIKRDSVRERLERDQGMSYTEFTYMLMQAYDFLHLYREHSVTVQMAGSDQWGNIVSGVDLIRRIEAHDEVHDAAQNKTHAAANPEAQAAAHAFGLTAPLLLKSDGTKFGKTEAGAVWLSHDPQRPQRPGTSPYGFYQFWLNADDADVPRYLRMFTMLPRPEIEELERLTREAPQQRAGQRVLAREVTALLHGQAARERAEAASKALFSGQVAGLERATLEEVFAEVPATEHARSELSGDGVALVDVLPRTSLATSKREARQFLADGAVLVNGAAARPDERLSEQSLLHNELVLLRRGRKNWHVLRWR